MPSKKLAGWRTSRSAKPLISDFSIRSSKPKPTTMASIRDLTDSYKVGVILQLEECGKCRVKSGKVPRALKVKVHRDDDNTITVVTSATNVRQGSRYVRYSTVARFCMAWPMD